MHPTTPAKPTRPAVHGVILALLAAILFGASTPLVQRFGVGVGAFTTACLLYAGAAAAGVFSLRRMDREARLARADMPRLLAMALLGAALAPAALAWGLQRTSGTSASLMLTLEALFTVLLARLLYRETFDRRVGIAMVLLLAGGLALVLDKGAVSGAGAVGLLAVLVATAAWGADNALSRALAERDPAQVVLAKPLLGGGATAALAYFGGESAPSATSAMALFAVGATGYGFSLRLYLLAQRAFGAARTGSVFAFAPFIGAAVAFGLGERSGSWMTVLACVLMVLGVLIHLRESHAHAHTHEAIEHEHAHRHDDAHHLHVHAQEPSAEPHNHRHTHTATSHNHPHVPDAHHDHVHRP